MKRTTALIASVALALSLAACGSSSDSSTSSAPAVSSSPGVAVESSAGSVAPIPDRQTLIDKIRADGMSSGFSTEQVDCIIDAISPLDASQLQAGLDGTPDAATEIIMGAASEKCLTASPAAS